MANESRTTKQIAEVLVTSDAGARTTKQVAEAIVTSSAGVRVTKQVIEVLVDIDSTQALSVDITSSALVSATLGERQFLAADITGTAIVSAPHPTPYTQLELFDGVSCEALVTADINTNLVSASNTITFTQNVIHLSIKTGNTVQLTQSATVEVVLGPPASDFLILGYEVTADLIYTRSLTSVLGALDHLATVDRVLPTKTASNSITFTDAADWSRPVDSTLSLTQTATGEVYFVPGIASNALSLTQSASPEIITNVSAANILAFAQAATLDRELSDSASSSLSLNQTVYFVNLEGGEVTLCGDGYTKQYVVLQVADSSVVLPAPLWGDTENITSEMSLLRSMNGVTRTYVKTNKNRRLTYTFRLLSRAKAIELLEFLRSYDSVLIKLTNWKGEVWRVNLLNNPSDFVQTRRFGTDISLEFEGEKLYG